METVKYWTSPGIDYVVGVVVGGGGDTFVVGAAAAADREGDEKGKWN